MNDEPMGRFYICSGQNIGGYCTARVICGLDCDETVTVPRSEPVLAGQVENQAIYPKPANA